MKVPLHDSPVRGSNLTTVRGINERLILHLVRRHGALTKAEVTRTTGLSPNAASVIIRALENDKLLLRGEPIRGRIGQPSVPMRLNPEARHYIGLKIGRRSSEIVLINFIGDILERYSESHPYPTPAKVITFVKRNLDPILESARKSRDDVSALNVAMPFDLWSWTDDLGAPQKEMNAWRSFDLSSELSKLCPWPVNIENDGSAASRAELVFAPPKAARDFAYFFIGAFVGGGVILNSSVYLGPQGRAGGFGPLRIPDEPGGDRLVDHASLIVLERLLQEKSGRTLSQISSEDENWETIEPFVQCWLNRAGRTLAHAIISTLAVIDFEGVVIDGAFPPSIRIRLVNEVGKQLDQLDMQGVVRPTLQAGHFGSVARALGAAAFQISTEYMIDQNTLLKQAPAIDVG